MIDQHKFIITNTMKFANKRILITGASSGIGKAFALRTARDGATLILAARNLEKLNETKSEVEKAGGKAEVIVTDVTKVDEIRNMFFEATKDGQILDLVFDNAGLGYIANIYDLKTDEIEKMIDVNVKGQILVAKFASEVFVRQNYGHLIMTASLAGLITLPQWSVYVATKWAITGFADCIRMELHSKNIKVTSLHPGAVKTEFFDKEKANVDIEKIGEAITPEEVADAVYNAAFTNQQRIVIPAMSKNYSLLYRFAPGIVQKLIERLTSNVKYRDIVEEDEPGFSYIQSANPEE